jgi:hypothetical protein
VAASSSWDKMTKPHRLPEERSSTKSCKSLGMTLTYIPFAIQKTNPPAVHPQPTWTNYSSLGTLRYSQPPFQNSTSSDHHGQPCHTNRTQGCHPQISTTARICRPWKLWKSLGSYPEMIGTRTLRGWRHSMTIPSQGWEEDQWKPPFTGMTSSPTIPSSFCHGGATAPVTRAHSGQGKTHIPDESSPAKKHTPSSWGRHSP